MSYDTPTYGSTIFGLFRSAASLAGAADRDRQAVEGRRMAEQKTTRREVIQKVVYVAPAILTLVAIPTFASAGSGAQSRHRGQRLRELMERLQERRH